MWVIKSGLPSYNALHTSTVRNTSQVWCWSWLKLRLARSWHGITFRYIPHHQNISNANDIQICRASTLSFQSQTKALSLCPAPLVPYMASSPVLPSGGAAAAPVTSYSLSSHLSESLSSVCEHVSHVTSTVESSVHGELERLHTRMEMMIDEMHQTTNRLKQTSTIMSENETQYQDVVQHVVHDVLKNCLMQQMRARKGKETTRMPRKERNARKDAKRRGRGRRVRCGGKKGKGIGVHGEESGSDEEN